MAAYRRVYDSRHLQTDCKEPGSAPEPYARYSTTFLPLQVTVVTYFKCGGIVKNQLTRGELLRLLSLSVKKN